MGRNSHYFTNKEERKAHAAFIKEDNEKRFADAIRYSIDKRDLMSCRDMETIMERGVSICTSCNPSPSMYVAPVDSVSALFQLDQILENAESRKNPCVLNFASFTIPGGMFLNGSSAQEESLCHESTLYNILSSDEIMKEFYEPHREMKKELGYLYNDDSLVTPNVIFFRETDGLRQIEYADVITCAAPNAHAEMVHGSRDRNRIKPALARRIFSLMYHAMVNFNDVLIVGAFGCGVFDNDPVDVAWAFKYFTQTAFQNYFSAVIFAVPSDGASEKNYYAFKKVIFDNKYDDTFLDNCI